jgi:hypothetical protein
MVTGRDPQAETVKRRGPWPYFSVFSALLGGVFFCYEREYELGFRIFFIAAGLVPPLLMLCDGLWKGVLSGSSGGFCVGTLLVGGLNYGASLEFGVGNFGPDDWIECLRLGLTFGVPLGALAGGFIQAARLEEAE